MLHRILTVAVLTVLAGCVDRTPAPSGSAATTTATPATAAPSKTDVVELVNGAGDAAAFALAPGSFISGEIRPPVSRIAALSVQIGNYANTADGGVAVELCQADACSSGKAALAGSADNQYLQVSLDRPLEIVEMQPVRYRIIKVDGSRPVAVWLYPPSESVSSVSINDQARQEGAPKLAIHR